VNSDYSPRKLSQFIRGNELELSTGGLANFLELRDARRSPDLQSADVNAVADGIAKGGDVVFVKLNFGRRDYDGGRSAL
jgi:hypothetical protein